MFAALKVSLKSWLDRRRNPLLRDPEYARFDAEERALNGQHKNASGPRQRKQDRLHAMLRGAA